MVYSTDSNSKPFCANVYKFYVHAEISRECSAIVSTLVILLIIIMFEQLLCAAI